MTPATSTPKFVRGILGEQPCCEGCPLKGRPVVPPEGNPDAKIAVVGEGPGGEETLQLRPFVGRSGKLLDKLLQAAGLLRSEVFLTNGTLCQPRSSMQIVGEQRVYLSPDDAKVIAAKHCRLRFFTELQALPNLEVVVPLGALAYEAVRGARHSIQARRGAIFEFDLDQRAVEAWHEVRSLYGLEPKAERSRFQRIRFGGAPSGEKKAAVTSEGSP